MALRGHVFNKQLFSSDCFALFVDRFLNGNNGVVFGCNLTTSETQVAINKGFFLIQGRFLQEEGTSTFPITALAEGQKEYAKLICEVDLSKTNTPSILNQAYYKIITDSSDYPILIQDDIVEEPTAGIYQYEFCKFEITENGVENFVDTRQFIDFEGIYAEVRRDMNQALAQAEIDKEQFFADWQNDFDTWFQGLQDVLDEDTAGHLLNLINGLQSQINNIKEELVSAIEFKGVVANYSDLPATGQINGDCYLIENADTTHNINAGDLVVWVVTNDVGSWVNMGGHINIDDLRPKYKTITINTSAWVQDLNTSLYVATITDTTVTINTFVELSLDLANQEKLGSNEIESFNGYFEVRTADLPSETVTAQVVYTETEAMSI